MITEIKKYQAYQPLKDDVIDEALAEYIANRGRDMQVPFIREDEGIYLFGSKRVFAKLDCGKVIIRIGGGFMPVEQFVDVYTPMEMERMDTKKKPADNKKGAIGKLANSMVNSKGGGGLLKDALGGGKFSPMLGLAKKGQEAAKKRRGSNM